MLYFGRDHKHVCVIISWLVQNRIGEKLKRHKLIGVYGAFLRKNYWIDDDKSLLISQYIHYTLNFSFKSLLPKTKFGNPLKE